MMIVVAMLHRYCVFLYIPLCLLYWLQPNDQVNIVLNKPRDRMAYMNFLLSHCHCI